MKIMVANPNSNKELTDVLMESARRDIRDSSVELIPFTNPLGSKHIDSVFGDYQSVWSFVREILKEIDEVKPDAVVLAGFGNFGMFALKEALSIPVIPIAEASQMIAPMLGHRYSVLTVFNQNIPYQEDLTRLFGIESRLASVRGIEMNTDIVETTDTTKASLEYTVDKLIHEDGAEVVVLGGARFAPYAQMLSDKFNIPVIDPVAVSVKLAILFVESGLSQSKIRKFNQPPQPLVNYFVGKEGE